MGVWQRSGWHTRVLSEVRSVLAVRALAREEEGRLAVCTTIVPASAVGVVRIEREVMGDGVHHEYVTVRRVLGALPYQSVVALTQHTPSRAIWSGVEPRLVTVVPPSLVPGSGIALSPMADLLEPPVGIGLLSVAGTSPYRSALAAYVDGIAALLEPVLPMMSIVRDMCREMLEQHSQELFLSAGLLASWLVLPSNPQAVPVRRLINHLSRQTSGAAVPRLLDALFPGRRQSDEVTIDELARVFELDSDDRILAFCSPLLPPHIARFYLSSICGHQVELPPYDRLPTFVVPQGSTHIRLYPLYHTIAASLGEVYGPSGENVPPSSLDGVPEGGVALSARPV